MALIMTNKEFVAGFKQQLIDRAQACTDAGVVPTLAVVRVGEKPDSVAYEQSAMKRAAALGVEAKAFTLPEDATLADVQATLTQINQDPAIHGCLLLRPMPKHIDDFVACNALCAEKDSDGITIASAGAVFSGAEGFAPCTAEACMRMLDAYNVSLEGKKVAVVGRSLVVGRPLSMLLLARNATVTICHSRTKDLSVATRDADIVVCATGRAKAYGAEFFRSGQIVLDVGTNFDDDGKLCGDVDFDAVEPVVDAITPVPGGIGGITTCVLIDHVIAVAERGATNTALDL